MPNTIVPIAILLPEDKTESKNVTYVARFYDATTLSQVGRTTGYPIYGDGVFPNPMGNPGINKNSVQVDTGDGLESGKTYIVMVSKSSSNRISDRGMLPNVNYITMPRVSQYPTLTSSVQSNNKSSLTVTNTNN